MTQTERRIDDIESALLGRARRWVVTGGAGFIGSHLCERLLELGQHVVAYDNLSTGYLHNVEEVRESVSRRCGDAVAKRLQFIEGDIRDRDALGAALASADHVLHQAAVASVPKSMSNPELHHASNTDGFFQVLQSARAAGVASLVYASSSSVYGDDQHLPKTEERTGTPLSPYAATKVCNEVYASTWRRAFEMSIRGIRYFNVFGPRQDPNGAYAAVIPRWIDLLLRGERPVVFGDGETSRDFCPVANIVQMNLLAALASDQVAGDVFNAALGRRTTLNELFIVLRDGLARHGVSCGDVVPKYEAFRPGDVRHSLADISRARAQLGYEPDVSLEAGFELTVRWFMSQSRAGTSTT